jgi:hypothetical protein
MERREEQSGVTPPAPGGPGAPAAHEPAASAAGDAGERRQEPGPDRRQSVVDRRFGTDRRQLSREQSNFTGPERRSGVDRRAVDEATGDTGLERRRGPGRRRSDDRRSAEEGEMTAEQFEFVKAIETYKKVNKRMYPTWTEVLEVIRQLGYRKVCPRDIHLDNVPEPTLQKVA